MSFNRHEIIYVVMLFSVSECATDDNGNVFNVKTFYVFVNRGEHIGQLFKFQMTFTQSTSYCHKLLPICNITTIYDNFK